MTTRHCIATAKPHQETQGGYVPPMLDQPGTTYDNAVGDCGEKYVEVHTKKGKSTQVMIEIATWMTGYFLV